MTPRARARAVGLAAALLAAGAGLALTATGCGDPAPAAATTPRPAAGPPLTLAWPALDGGTIELASLRGQVVVIHAFTIWSLAAQLEVEGLDAADARPDVTVIGLALDAEGYRLVAPWRKGANARHLIALADDATRRGATPLGPIHQVPTTFLLDRSGRLDQRLEYQLAPAELDAAIAATAAR